MMISYIWGDYIDKIIQRTLEAIVEVRNSGVTNMMDSKRVLEEISNNCSDDINEFINEHEDEYLFLLKLSGKL